MQHFFKCVVELMIRRLRRGWRWVRRLFLICIIGWAERTQLSKERCFFCWGK